MAWHKKLSGRKRVDGQCHRFVTHISSVSKEEVKRIEKETMAQFCNKNLPKKYFEESNLEEIRFQPKLCVGGVKMNIWQKRSTIKNIP